MAQPDQIEFQPATNGVYGGEPRLILVEHQPPFDGWFAAQMQAFAGGPTGAEMKDYYVNGGFAAMLENLRANQIAGGKITEAEVKPLEEVFIDTFALKATEGY